MAVAMDAPNNSKLTSANQKVESNACPAPIIDVCNLATVSGRSQRSSSKKAERGTARDHQRRPSVRWRGQLAALARRDRRAPRYALNQRDRKG
jgi:hypothetical protein